MPRHRENFGAFTGPKGDFGLILLILNMIIHKSFTGPTQFLPVNVRGPVSFAVFACQGHCTCTNQNMSTNIRISLKHCQFPPKYFQMEKLTDGASVPPTLVSIKRFCCILDLFFFFIIIIRFFCFFLLCYKTSL